MFFGCGFLEEAVLKTLFTECAPMETLAVFWEVCRPCKVNLVGEKKRTTVGSWTFSLVTQWLTKQRGSLV